MDKPIDPEISAYFSKLGKLKQQKNPYHHFQDPEKAREANRKSQEAKKRRRDANQ